MRKQTLLTVAVIGLLVLNIAVLAMVYFHWRELHDSAGPLENIHPPERIISERLQLDEARYRELGNLKSGHMEIMKRINDDERRLHDELFNLLKEENPDKTKADSLINLIAENKKKAEVITYNHFSDIKKLCVTEKQKKLFNEFIDELGKMIGPPGIQQHPPLQHLPRER